MKTHFKIVATAIMLALIGGCIVAPFIALAAVPLHWNVETSRANPASFDVYRGETLELHADLLNYGRPIEVAGAVALYVQTNGMDNAWWTLPATVTGSCIKATLSPDNYPASATALNCFIGGPASSYRAAFRLRILGSPGSEPNTVSPPVVTLDYDAITVLNPPYWTRDEADARYGGASVTESVVAGWGFTKTVLPSVWPWASISGRPDMTQYLTATAASATYASQSALTTGLAGKLDANGGTATALSIGSMSLGQYGDLFEYRLNFDDTSYSTYLAMPGCAWSLGLILPTYETLGEPTWEWEERRVIASRPWVEEGFAPKADVISLNQTVASLSAYGQSLSTTVESYHLDRFYTLASRTSYQAAGNSVQYITLAAGTTSLSITPPTAVSGRVRDWVVYLFPAANVTLSFASSAHWYASDTDGVKSAASGKITKFAFSEIGMNASTGKPQFSVIKTELQEIQ